MKPVLLDTGVIVALLDRSERHHAQCVEVLQGIQVPLVTCEAVLAESCYLLRNLRGAAAAVLDNVAAGIFQLPFQLSKDAAVVKRILRKYQDRRIDLADACLIALADEFQTGEILTLDNDFHIYRWGRHKPFHNLISLN